MPRVREIKRNNSTLRNLLLDLHKIPRAPGKGSAIFLCLRKIKTIDILVHELHGANTYPLHICITQEIFRARSNILTLKEFGSFEKMSNRRTTTRGCLSSWRRKFGLPLISPKIFYYVNNKNTTKHRDKILHFTKRTLHFYLFSATSLILTVNIFMMIPILIRFMGKNLESFECTLRKVSASRILSPFF